ncbi:cadherin EGF LAG seven-pass G-type receptor 2-like isoform X2 [Artemia franciscana]|uniref:Cadherin domain-containing protein n=2 Tax=Artemia franciscana TaxID=6661 RepID=A0AA88LFK5_ARTSF|nr:hypothetical protein QYM36_005276 [Artemia franciscana]KAK2719746.1 hypothetical protein QYM36_005276 [Artemia franciscana]
MKSLVWLSVLITGFSASSAQDNRCFLEKGGSSEIFFVGEDIEVGSVIGTLEILGEIEKKSGISLRLSPQDVEIPVEIKSGTKDLILRRSLDKEGLKGPSSVSISVICDKLDSSDPGLVIPVNIRVTDVNDNYPEFVNEPYTVSTSEAAPVGSMIFNEIRAVDADQPGPFSTVEYSLAQGEFSDFFEFKNSLDGSLFLRKPLDYETFREMVLVIIARDQGNPPLESRTSLHVSVLDADDRNPAFTAPTYYAFMQDDAREGKILDVGPKKIEAFDQDLGITAPLRYSIQNDEGLDRYFGINSTTKDIYIMHQIPEFEFVKPTTFVIKAMQIDNPDRYALAPLTISRGPNFNAPVQFTQRSHSVSVPENTSKNTTLLVLTTNRPGDRRVKFNFEDGSTDLFYINANAEVILVGELDFEEQEEYQLTAKATDGLSFDTCDITVKVLNVNDWDPMFGFGAYDFYVTREEMTLKNISLGRIEVYDKDVPDEITLDLRGSDVRFFEISQDGDIFVKDPSIVNVTTANLVITAKDNGIPSRQASVPVTVHFPPELIVRSQLAGFGDDLLLPIILGSILVGFMFLVAGLVAYICHNRRKTKRASSVTPLVTQFERTPSEKARTQILYAYPQRVTEANKSSIYLERCQNPMAKYAAVAKSSNSGSIPSSSSENKTSLEEMQDSKSIKSLELTTSGLLPGQTQFHEWLGTVKRMKPVDSIANQDRERWQHCSSSFYGEVEKDKELDGSVNVQQTAQVKRTPSQSAVSRLAVLY